MANVGHCPKRKGGQNPSRQQRQGTNSIGGSVTVPNTDTSREQHFKRKGEVGDTTQNELDSAQNTRDIYGSGCLRNLKHGYQHWSLGP